MIVKKSRVKRFNVGCQRRLAAACTAALLASASIPTARANDIYWANSVSGHYSTAANWVGNVVPGSRDVPHLNAYDSSSDPYTLTLTGNVTNAGLAVTAVSTTISVNLGGDTWTQTGAITVGRNATVGPTLYLYNGTMTTTAPAGTESYIGQSAGDVGEVDVDSTGSHGAATWNHNGTLSVGSSGQGTLYVGGFAKFFESGSLVIGENAGSVGTFGAAGYSASFSGADVVVGESGSGFFYDDEGCTATINGHNLLIGENAGSTGEALVADGSLSTGYAYVGLYGNGQEILEGQSIHQVYGDLVVGSYANSVGSIQMTFNSVSDGTLEVDGAVFLGASGNGTINQSGGVITIGSDIPNTLYIGHDSGSGTYLLSSTGSLIDNGDEIVGWYGSGIFNQTGGTNTVGAPTSPWHLYPGFQSGSTGTYGLGGSAALTVNNVEDVGYSGTGIFNQSGGNHQVNGQLNVGYSASSSAVYRLSGPNSTLNVTGSEVIGVYSAGNGSTPGAVFQQNGGTNNAGLYNTPAPLTIGQNAGSNGLYQLSGGTLNVGGNSSSGLLIGGAGNGVFNQTGGTLNTTYEAVGNSSTGTVIQSGGFADPSLLQVGVSAQAVGKCIFSGGSPYASEEDVGISGSGTFNQSGGVNQANLLDVATASGGNGKYILSDGLLVGAYEYIGYNAGGSFLQTGGSNASYYDLIVGIFGGSSSYSQTGGLLSSGEELVGIFAGATGTVVMTGGVAQADSLGVGSGSSTGSVIIEGTGVFSVGSGSFGGLVVSSGSTLSISGSGRLNFLPHTAASFTADTVSSLSISGQGVLDLSNNALDLPGATLSTIMALVSHGYNGGTWNGTGITSTTAASDTQHLTALGVIQNDQSATPLYTSSNQFEGVIPGPSDILIKYTFYGDANLDGKVDGSDYSRIDNGYLNHLTG